jgi:hypothetical protein
MYKRERTNIELVAEAIYIFYMQVPQCSNMFQACHSTQVGSSKPAPWETQWPRSLGIPQVVHGVVSPRTGGSAANASPSEVKLSFSYQLA